MELILNRIYLKINQLIEQKAILEDSQIENCIIIIYSNVVTKIKSNNNSPNDSEVENIIDEEINNYFALSSFRVKN